MYAERSSLATLLAAERRSTVVRFVAALYVARGATVDVEGDVLVVDGQRHLVVSGTVGRLRNRVHPPDDIDAIVVVDERHPHRLAARHDARVVSTADLDRLARYGLPRDVADHLFRDAFGRPVGRVAPPRVPPLGSLASDDGDAVASSAFASTAGLSLLAVVVLVVAALVTPFTGPLAMFSGGAVAADDAGFGGVSSSANTTGDAIDAQPAATPSANTSVPDEARLSLAPGLSTRGITDPDRLADAHAAALANQSYRWELTYVEAVDGDVTVEGRETVRVAEPRVFVSTANWTGEPTSLTPLASRPSYADGTVRYRPTDPVGITARPLPEYRAGGAQGWRAARYLSWYLSSQESSIDRQLIHTAEPTYIVTLDGTAYPGVRSYGATAQVDADGFVRSLVVRYELVDRERLSVVHVRMTFRYHDLGTTTVSPPPWYTAGASTTETQSSGAATAETQTSRPAASETVTTETEVVGTTHPTNSSSTNQTNQTNQSG